MPIGVIAFVVYILAILVWMLVIKRNIAEAMLVGLIVIALFNGPANILTTLWDATFAASKQETGTYGHISGTAANASNHGIQQLY